jgi:hypothetical protein
MSNPHSKLSILHDDTKATTTTGLKVVGIVAMLGRPVTSCLVCVALSSGSSLGTARHTTYVDATTTSTTPISRPADVDAFLAACSSLATDIDIIIARDTISETATMLYWLREVGDIGIAVVTLQTAKRICGIVVIACDPVSQRPLLLWKHGLSVLGHARKQRVPSS